MENAKDRILGIDVGGTFIKYALMNQDADILEKGEIPTPYESRDHFIDTLADLYEKYPEVIGIAVSIPGGVDAEKGFITNPGNLSYNQNSNLKELLEKRILKRTGKEVPVFLENDGKAAALAEVWKGNLQGVENGAVIILGTGIGGGIVINGEVLKGKNFFAGEMSFVLPDLRSSGFENVLAMNASTAALTGRSAKAAGLASEEVDGFKVMELLNQNHPGVSEVFDDVCEQLAGLIYNLICLLNVEKVLIGGGISRQPLIVDTIRKKTNEKISRVREAGMPIPGVEVDVCRYFNDSNLIGALANFQKQSRAASAVSQE